MDAIRSLILDFAKNYAITLMNLFIKEEKQELVRIFGTISMEIDMEIESSRLNLERPIINEDLLNWKKRLCNAVENNVLSQNYMLFNPHQG